MTQEFKFLDERTMLVGISALVMVVTSGFVPLPAKTTTLGLKKVCKPPPVGSMATDSQWDRRLSTRVRKAREGTILGWLSSWVGLVFLALVATRGGDPPPFLTLREIMAGGVAAAFAEITLYPIEVLKVRVQTGKKVALGDLMTWRRPGVVAGTLRALSYHGLRLGLFPAVNRCFGGDGLLRKLVVGAACGALGAAIVNPLDLTKTRLQRDPDRYGNSIDALVTIPNEGRGSLWVGAPASIARAAAGSSGQLTAYDVVKSSFGATTGVSVVAGAVAATAAYVTCAAPFDVVKSRLMTSSTTNSSVLTCLLNIARHEGPLALFTGWLPSLLRLLPTTLVVFPLLERFRLLLGTGAF